MATLPDIDNSTPTPDDVEAVSAISDPVIRNLRITQAYYDLSTSLRGQVTLGANWCTFATWASRQAGCTIRGEDIVEALKRRALLPSKWTGIAERVGRWLVRQGLFNSKTRLGRLANATYSPIGGLEKASRDIADGNKKVFEEIAFVFAGFLESRAADAESDEAAMAAFITALHPGPPPAGQDYLHAAFANYYNAKFMPASTERAQLEYLANLQIGLHEQIRLQDQIEAGLEDIPVQKADWDKSLLHALFPGSEQWWGWLQGSVAPILRVVMAPARRLMLSLVRDVITHELLSLTVAGRSFSLAASILLPPSPALAQLKNPELVNLLAGLPPAKADPDEVGAKDWANLGQRMRYIAYLFRAYHEAPEVYEKPFTDEQRALILDGVVPAGQL